MNCDFQKYRVRDPIHGFIGFSEIERKVINTNIFQRLRRIKQLALANYVYPGALHTRFDHSLGVLHIAGRMADNLYKKVFKTKEDIQIIRLAALLHDLGHGPFSHISEYLLKKYSDSQKLKSLNIEEIHEDITYKLIQNDKELSDILGEELKKNVLDVLSTDSISKDIISGPIDADKFDYLKRDAYFAGVKYGEFDLDKILESISFSESERYYLGISEEGVFAIEQYILAKHHMNAQVYRHKIRGIIDQMVIRGIDCAIQNGDIKMKKLFNYDGSEKFIDNYIKWDDFLLMDYLVTNRCEKTKEIFQRLCRRKLLKRIHKKSIHNFDDAMPKLKFQRILQYTGFDFTGKEREIGKIKLLNCDKNFVIINIISINNPLFKPPSNMVNEQDIKIVFNKNKNTKKRKTKMLKDIPWSILSLPGTEDKHPSLEVYAPLDNLENNPEKEKDRIKAKIDNEVSKILYQ